MAGYGTMGAGDTFQNVKTFDAAVPHRAGRGWAATNCPRRGLAVPRGRPRPAQWSDDSPVVADDAQKRIFSKDAGVFLFTVSERER